MIFDDLFRHAFPFPFLVNLLLPHFISGAPYYALPNPHNTQQSPLLSRLLSYFRLYAYISKFWARNWRRERTCDICLWSLRLPHSIGTLKFHLFTWQFHNLFFFVTPEQSSMAPVYYCVMGLLFLLMQGSGEETKSRWWIGRLFCYLPPPCMCLDGRVQHIELNFVQVVPDKAAGACSVDSFLLLQLVS